MSMKALTQIWETKTGGPAEKLVAAILADHANDEMECYPSISRIAKRADMSERGVRKCLRRLEESGIISTVQNDAQRGCNRYRINTGTPELRSPRNHVPPEQCSPPPGTTFPPTPEPRSVDPGTTFPRTLIEPPSITLIEPPKKKRTAKSETAPEYTPDFCRLYDLHPKKKDKAEALKAFNAIVDKPDIETLCRILRRDIEREGVNWTKEGGQYCPALGPWMRKRRWDDGDTGASKLTPEQEREAALNFYGATPE